MPRTHMQATRTYLELSRESQFNPGFGAFPDLVIERVERSTPGLYRECYRTVGEAYHWRDRWDWTDAELRRHLADPASPCTSPVAMAACPAGTSLPPPPTTTPSRSRISGSRAPRTGAGPGSTGHPSP